MQMCLNIIKKTLKKSSLIFNIYILIKKSDIIKDTAFVKKKDLGLKVLFYSITSRKKRIFRENFFLNS